jgi:hypothetical protein
MLLVHQFQAAPVPFKALCRMQYEHLPSLQKRFLNIQIKNQYCRIILFRDLVVLSQVDFRNYVEGRTLQNEAVCSIKYDVSPKSVENFCFNSKFAPLTPCRQRFPSGLYGSYVSRN